LEEDFYSIRGRDVAMQTYTAACAAIDPEHPKKKTRWDWGRGPGLDARGADVRGARASPVVRISRQPPNARSSALPIGLMQCDGTKFTVQT